jgi:hypothetical protein
MHEHILKFVRFRIFLQNYRLQNCRNTEVCIFYISYIVLLVIIYFSSCFFKSVKIVYHSWRILLIVFFVYDSNAYVSINASQHNGMDFMNVFLPVLANVRHPQEGCDTKQ